MTAAQLPQAVQEMHGAVLNGRIYIAGGIVQGNLFSNRTYRYDPATNNWQRRADLPAARHHMPLVALGDSLYAIGGLGPVGFEAQRNLWLYVEEEDRWLLRTGPTFARGASAAVALNGRIYLMGGFSVDSRLVGEFEVYDPATNRWTQLAPLPEPLDHLAAVALDGKVYAIAGRAVMGGTIRSIVQRYDPEEDRWDEVARLPAATAGHAAAVLDGRIHVVGGELVGAAFDYHFAYDPAEDVWSDMKPLPTGRHGLAAAVVGSRLFTIGGGPFTGFSQSDVVEVFERE